MSKRVAFQILDDKNKIHWLRYKLYDSRLANLWAELVDINLQKTDGRYIHSVFMNKTEQDFPQIITEMNVLSKSINRQYDRVLPYFDDESFLNQDILNMLHEEYEVYGDRKEEFIEKETFNKSLDNNFLRLNELIHLCEIIMEQKYDTFDSMSALVDFHPRDIHEWITEIDKLYLTTNINWGKLYLGYSTLGKDWLEISHHNDIDVIVRDQVRPQRTFSAESWLNFSGDVVNYSSAIEFEKWYNTLSDDIKGKVPIDFLNDLSLGRFEIGTLVFDEQFLNFHDNERDWMSTSHPVKRKWNTEIFSTFKKVIGIKVYDWTPDS